MNPITGFELEHLAGFAGICGPHHFGNFWVTQIVAFEI